MITNLNLKLRFALNVFLVLFAMAIIHANASAQTTIFVDTTSGIYDGDTSSVEALLEDPGEDGKISLIEALMAINKTGPGFTVRFALEHGDVIEQGYQINVPNTTIDGDIDGDEIPDVAVISELFAAGFNIHSDHNLIQNIVVETIYVYGEDAHHNVIRNSYIGTDLEGKLSSDSGYLGVGLVNGAHHNLVEDNIIAGNAGIPYDRWDVQMGILIGGANFNEIRGNRIGVNVAGEQLGNDVGIYLAGHSEGNVIGGERSSLDCTSPCNIISGNKGSAIIVHGSNAVNNRIQGNFIGMAPNGENPLQNGWIFPASTLYLRCGASENLIGGPRQTELCDGPCNLISGNNGHAIGLFGPETSENKIQGNYLGTNITGTLSRRNRGAGVFIQDQPSPTCPGPTTLKSFGDLTMADLSADQESLHLAQPGSQSESESRSLSTLEGDLGPTDNLIGGARPGVECSGVCNVISGNDYGIRMLGEGVDRNLVQGNYIGLGAGGTLPLRNIYRGVFIQNGASENVIGGDRQGVACDGFCNVISNHENPGIWITSTGTDGNEIRGNYIGVNPAGDEIMPNQIGVRVGYGPKNTLIGGARGGGACSGPCNLIRGNEGVGIEISNDDAVGTTIRGNAIYGNGGLGIDLGGDGVTYNVPEASQIRPETWMVFPVGVSAEYVEYADVTRVQATLQFENPDSVIVDFYASEELDPSGYGEGQSYLGQAHHIGDGVFELAFPGKLDYVYLSATATNPEGSTSEFGPRPPLILIPGISGSELVAEKDANQLWPGALADHHRLSLYPDDAPESIYATDVIRTVLYVTEFYQGIIDFLEENAGYREYLVEDHLERRTSAGCDLSQMDETPNFFVFAYDWRLDNEDSAQALEEFIRCIQKFYPGSKVDLLAHSMGGLVARKYMLLNPNEDQVNKLITIGTPWLGAPKLTYVLETGSMDFWINQIIWRKTLKYVMGSFDGAHQLLPSAAYYNLFGGSSLVEVGWDLNRNNVFYENYTYSQFLEAVDQRYGRGFFNPGSTSDVFHAAAGQDDWSSDPNGNRYYHIYGIQNVGENQTIGKVAAVSKLVCGFIVDYEGCVRDPVYEFVRYKVQGDGTVPLLSARRPGLNAPGSHLIAACASDAGGDKAVEHTQLTRNPNVQEVVFGILNSGWYDPISPSPDGCAQAPLNPSLQAASALNYYLTLFGAGPLTISDRSGNTVTLTDNLLQGEVPGVDLYPEGEQVVLAILPTTSTFEVTFTTTDAPLAVEITRGTNTSADLAVRYLDLALPENLPAILTLGPGGIEDLVLDSDGDDIFETVIDPSLSLTGEEANDLRRPELTVSANGQREKVSVSLHAQDAGSGVKQILYSLDGVSYHPYAEPLELNPDQIPFLYAFADDHAGNRTAIAYDLTHPVAPAFAIYLPMVIGPSAP